MNAADLIGQLLSGRYRVVSRLGSGGMATVYLARQETLQRKVVVKFPDAALLEDEQFVKRFQLEIRSTTSLRHPRIVSILDTGELDGVPWYAMDFLEGGSLHERMAAGGSEQKGSEGPEIPPWVRPICEALDFIHGKDLVHRDVKPANILFDESGNPFLSDFGIARAIGSTDTRITNTGIQVGTVLYMAPEQGMTTTITGAADQYSLAAILYEHFAGRPPIEGENAPITMVKKLTEDPASLSDLVPLLPANVSSAIARALDRKPENRFPSCTAFLDALESGDLEPRTIALPITDSAEREAAAARLESTPRKRRRLIGGAVLLFILAVIASILVAVLGRAEPEPTPPIVTDRTPPVVTIDPVPAETDAASMTLMGTLSEDGCRLTVNGTPVHVAGRSFEVVVSLTLGRNRTRVVATDAAGNSGETVVVQTVRIPPESVEQKSPDSDETFSRFERLLAKPTWKEADPEPGREHLRAAIHRRTGLTFVLIPAGTFLRATPKGGEPPHRVDVPAFLLCRTECTEAAFELVSGAGDRGSSGPEFPVADVLLEDVLDWCEKTGVRLPSEAEWEYGCRAGSTARWSCGDAEDDLAQVAWYNANAGGSAHAVGRKEPNAWGLFDLHGNVAEFCADRWADNYEGAPVDGSPRTAAASDAVVTRGGSWAVGSGATGSASRARVNPDHRSASLGFRPALTLP